MCARVGLQVLLGACWQRVIGSYLYRPAASCHRIAPFWSAERWESELLSKENNQLSAARFRAAIDVDRQNTRTPRGRWGRLKPSRLNADLDSATEDGRGLELVWRKGVQIHESHAAILRSVSDVTLSFGGGGVIVIRALRESREARINKPGNGF